MYMKKRREFQKALPLLLGILSVFSFLYDPSFHSLLFACESQNIFNFLHGKIQIG